MALPISKSDVGIVSVGVDMEVVGRWGRAPAFDGVGVGSLGEVLERVGRASIGCGVGGCCSSFGGAFEDFGKGGERCELGVCGFRSGGVEETLRRGSGNNVLTAL